jgi:spore photoproduct lyase
MSGSKLRLHRISADPSQLESEAVARVEQGSHNVAALIEPPKVADYRDGKLQLHLDRARGDLLHDCASMDARYRCCNVKVLATVSNCPYECSYCFLQNYLTDSTLSVVSDVATVVQQLRSAADAQPRRLLRVGTWELGDSLALESLTGTAAELVTAVAEMPNVLLELKTKSADVDGLLELDHRGRTVVAWTMNPEAVVRREELGTASVAARVEAMHKVIDAGYCIALHFDPMIYYPEWQAGYVELVATLFASVPAERVAWISIGSLRFNPEMRKVMAQNYPRSRAACAEMVLGDDNKVRYVKPLRLEMYRHLYQLLLEAGATDVLTYLCMERWDMWEKALGSAPDSTEALDFQFAESMQRRFPDLKLAPPELADYQGNV